MKKEKITRILGGIDDKYVLEAAEYPAEGAAEETAPGSAAVKRRRLKWLIPAAACLALLLAAGSAVAIAAEAREYSEAVSFFELNGLSREGLSRSEVKEVYRDITTQRFENEKTKGVLRNAVYGTEIYLEGPTPEETASSLWNKNTWLNTVGETGINYTFDYTYSENGVYHKSSFLNCYKDGELLWTSEIKDFVPQECIKTNAGTAVWGRGKTYISSRYLPAFVALLGENGELLWKRRLDHGSESEYVAKVLENDDGTWSVISRVDLKYLCLTRLDKDGNELSFNQTEIGNYGVSNAARLGEGFIVRTVSYNENEYATLYKLDGEGNIIDKISYDSDETMYYITDMAEFGGRLYISAYSVPRQEDAGNRNEIANILKFCHEKAQDYNEMVAREGIEARAEDIVPSEVLTPVVRDNYTAVLLICDPESGEPNTFYSVKGARGGRLSVTGERLDWNVNSITSAFYSPATSSFTIGGSCRVYCYSFDKDGELMGSADTGGMEQFAK